MKDLMKTNIYDCSEEIVIVGSCLKSMQPKAFKTIESWNKPIYDLCLEQTHLNMAITKVLGMIRTGKVKKLSFISVDRSPHCIQLHYIQDEIRKLGINIDIDNYVCSGDSLVKIDKEIITLSKNLTKLNEIILK